MDRVYDAIEQHKQKMTWQAEEEKIKRIPTSSKQHAYSVIQ